MSRSSASSRCGLKRRSRPDTGLEYEKWWPTSSEQEVAGQEGHPTMALAAGSSDVRRAAEPVAQRAVVGLTIRGQG
jgi:hypothetical protein